MPKSLIATFGWTEQFVLSSVLKYGLEQGDKIVLLVPDVKDEKSEAVIRDFKAFLKKYGEGIEVTVRRVSLESFDSAVATIASIIRELSSRGECIFNLSGGMRVLILAAYTAILLTCPKKVKIEVETEDRKRVFGIPNIAIGELVRLKDASYRILTEVVSKEILSSELIKKLKMPISTFHKNLRELERNGLIELRREGRSYMIRASPLGKLVVLASGLENKKET